MLRVFSISWQDAERLDCIPTPERGNE
jgi:hypothetical protein